MKKADRLPEGLLPETMGEGQFETVGRVLRSLRNDPERLLQALYRCGHTAERLERPGPERLLELCYPHIQSLSSVGLARLLDGLVREGCFRFVTCELFRFVHQAPFEAVQAGFASRMRRLVPGTRGMLPLDALVEAYLARLRSPVPQAEADSALEPLLSTIALRDLREDRVREMLIDATLKVIPPDQVRPYDSARLYYLSLQTRRPAARAGLLARYELSRLPPASDSGPPVGGILEQLCGIGGVLSDLPGSEAELILNGVFTRFPRSIGSANHLLIARTLGRFHQGTVLSRAYRTFLQRATQGAGSRTVVEIWTEFFSAWIPLMDGPNGQAVVRAGVGLIQDAGGPVQRRVLEGLSPVAAQVLRQQLKQRPSYGLSLLWRGWRWPAGAVRRMVGNGDPRKRSLE